MWSEIVVSTNQLQTGSQTLRFSKKSWTWLPVNGLCAKCNKMRFIDKPVYQTGNKRWL
jgi:hypothetical protein